MVRPLSSVGFTLVICPGQSVLSARLPWLSLRLPAQTVLSQRSSPPTAFRHSDYTTLGGWCQGFFVSLRTLSGPKQFLSRCPYCSTSTRPCQDLFLGPSRRGRGCGLDRPMISGVWVDHALMISHFRGSVNPLKQKILDPARRGPWAGRSGNQGRATRTLAGLGVQPPLCCEMALCTLVSRF